MNDIKQLFEEYYDQHFERLFGIIYKRSKGKTHLSEDLVHDFFVKLWKQLVDGQTNWEDFKKWSTTVLLNIWRDHCKRSYTKYVSIRGDDFESIQNHRQASNPEPEQNYDATEMMTRAILECTFQLAIHRDILRLLPEFQIPDDDSKTDQAIAAELGKSQSYIKTQRPKAISALKCCLRAKGIKLTDLT